jgi:hypothetical protein
MRILVCMVLSFALVACSTNGGVIEQTPDADAMVVPDQGGDSAVSTETIVPPDVTEILDDLDFELPLELDGGPDLPIPQCDPGEGCFLDGCDGNEDCQSGWCVQHLGEDVCSKTCQQECPPGWTCSQVAGTDPDVVYICVSDYANLCRPCTTNDNCTSTGGAEDTCLDYGSAGSFCGAPCGTDNTCPWGFSCLTTVTVDGVELSQCVNDTGECPCTERSIELGLATPCEVANEFGTCGGLRICGEEGLSSCDAVEPGEEVCNGLDDDCDGEVDEPALVAGDYVNLCFDGNDCTEDECSGIEGCVNTLLDSGQCNDGNPCTVADHCVEGSCTGAPVECDDSNPCTDDLCTDTGGCEFPPVEGKCDDDDPCTIDDFCLDGECGGSPVPCECMVDGDCAELEDGDLCNGTLVCDTSWPPYQCVVDLETEVVCPAPNGPHTPCLEASCDGATGLCSVVSANEEMPCDDGNACSVNDTCAGGECMAGGEVNCNDGNPCTDDSCDSLTGCAHTSNQDPCTDGDVCTTLDHCEAGDCVGGPPLVCDNSDVCDGQESCDGETGCLVGVPLVCDDGDPCTGLETCHSVDGCLSGEVLSCDDGNPCTDDSCDPAKGCQHEANGGECDDGNACTVGDHCVAGGCAKGGLLNCNDDSVCTNDTCDPEVGCINTLNTAPCDDGDLCTTGDQCKLGECAGTGDLACDDGNLCTDDSCGPLVGCQFVANDVQCDDGNACTDEDFCKAGWCSPGSATDCTDGNDCTADICSPLAGCEYANMENGTACVDEGIDKICVDGECLCKPDCEGKECGDDGCGGLCGSCEDEDECTLNEECVDGMCESTPLECDDGNGCTDDSCVADSGCVFTNNMVACDDGNPCTANDVCGDGSCSGESIPQLAPFKFTNASAAGRYGPTQNNLNSAYGGTNLAESVTSNGGIQTWTVPYTGTFTVEAVGAGGGDGPGNGGHPNTAPGQGASVTGDFTLQAGTPLHIVVGQTGALSKQGGWQAAGCSGGGGASYVYADANEDAPYLVAAGGGGQAEDGTGGPGSSTTSTTQATFGSGTAGAGGNGGTGGSAGPVSASYSPGAGGAGWLSNGQDAPTIRNTGGKGGQAPRNGAEGGYGYHPSYGAEHCSGGFGGGGAGSDNTGAAGGGGGYNGGGGGRNHANSSWGAGGGGGSYNAGANTSAQPGVNSGHGYVTVTFECN